MSGQIESSADYSSLYDEIPEPQEQAEDAGRPSASSENLAQTYAIYEHYANAGPSGEAQSQVERPKEEGVPSSPSPDLQALPEHQTPELSTAAQADFAAQRPNYQGSPIPQRPPLDEKNTPLYSTTQSKLEKRYAALGPLASPVASARARMFAGSLTKVGAEAGLYQMLYKTSPPPTEHDQHRLNHQLRQTIGNAPHQKILEQLNKGAQPVAKSSVHEQNAFHKQARSQDPSRRTTDALIKHTPSEQLKEAATAKDRDGKTPIALAQEGLDTAIEKGDEVQRQRLTHFIRELSKAAPSAEENEGLADDPGKP